MDAFFLDHKLATGYGNGNGGRGRWRWHVEFKRDCQQGKERIKETKPKVFLL